MKYYLVNFSRFRPFLAVDLNPEEIARIKAVKKTMTLNDEYAGYSPSEQAKWLAVEDIIKEGGKLVKFKEI